jgi:Family of unknown function (DUF6399)
MIVMDPRKTTTGLEKNSRITIAEKLSVFEEKLAQGKSQRKAAKSLGISRGTLLHWKNRTTQIPLSQTTIDFFESPDGAKFIERLVNVLQFVMTQVGSCGLRLVTMVLRLSSLDYFVASSYGVLRERGVTMEEGIVQFGEQERERLAAKMPKKKISIAEDETFHHKPCLVAIEPVSNFILLEEYGEKRDAESWNKALGAATLGLPIEIIQSTSDEARGIINHVEQHLGAHHSPDIFHVQQDITRATGAAMESKVRSVHQALDLHENEVKSRALHGHKNQRGRPSALSEQSDEDLQHETRVLREKLITLQTQQLAIKEAKKGISSAYHPYNLTTGAERQTDQVQHELTQYFETIEMIASAVSLRKTALDKIQKAKRVCSGLVATMMFFWILVGQFLEHLSVSQGMEWIIRDTLLPAAYLMLAAKKAKTAELKKQIQQAAEQLLLKLKNDDLWNSTAPSEQERLKKEAKECAQLFQRSSSCLEGRNGYLSLRHHGLHHLSTRKLGALTVIHNFFIKRSDQTTAAERFFEQKPRDLFEHIMQKMPSMPRPALQAATLRRAA